MGSFFGFSQRPNSIFHDFSVSELILFVILCFTNSPSIYFRDAPFDENVHGSTGDFLYPSNKLLSISKTIELTLNILDEEL